MVQFARAELDTHADTCVLGPGFVKLYDTGMTCTVAPYISTYDELPNIPIAAGATAYQEQTTGETIILEVHQALWYGDNPRMDHSLINPNQLRSHGVHVQDNPFSQHPMCVLQDDLIIPLHSQGTTIYFECRTPTEQELHDCRHVVLTSEHPWDPSTVHFREHTAADIQAYRHLHIQQLSSIREAPEIRGRQWIRQRLLCQTISERKTSSPFVASTRQAKITAEELSERWHISVPQALKALQNTTQDGIRSALLPLGRRYRADRMFRHPKLNATVYSDTMFGAHKSLDGNSCAQIFSTDTFFVMAYPMRTKAMAGDALREFIKDFGIMDQLITDGSKEQTGRNTEMVNQVKKYNIKHHVIESERYNQNRAEGAIREIKRRWYRAMVRKNVPGRLWDYGLRWVTEVMQRTPNTTASLKGRTPIEWLTGETPDITEYVDFGFYDFVWVRENAGLGAQILCRWLGVSHRVGSQLCYYVLKSNAQVISRTSVQRVTAAEKTTAEMKDRISKYNAQVELIINDDANILKQNAKQDPASWRQHSLSMDEEFIQEFAKVTNDPDVPEADDIYENDTGYHRYKDVELAFQRTPGEEAVFGRVTKRARGEDGLPIGRPHENPLMDTRVYEVEYMDGHKGTLIANQIAEAMYAQIDEEGNRHVMISDIIDHRTNDEQVKADEAFYTDSSGRQHRRRTTKGWELLVQWRDGSSTWVALKDMKEADPVKVAEYAKGNKIIEEPAFAWWAPYVLKKRKAIIAKVKSKYWLTSHKFGIRVPKSVKEALAIDAENHNTMWADAIKKEMKNVRTAFTTIEGGKANVPEGHQYIKCHMVFDIKLAENFRRKARFVAGGHAVDTPAILTYSSVVSRDSVRIGLLIAALNNLEVQAADIQNAYITAPCREKVWMVAGPEFGDEEGQVMLITRALYGLKSSGAAFRAHLAEALWDNNFRPTRGDNDVHIRPGIKSDGTEYYEMIMCYVDDIICIGEDATALMKTVVQERFRLKNDEIKPPQTYLGAQLQSKTINGNECWTMSSPSYVNSVVQRVEEQLGKKGKKLPTKASTPMTSNYRPEMDTTNDLDANDTRVYQEYIGMLRWAVELGRIDIMVEVSMLSSYLAAPREGHLQQAINIIAYLKKHPKRTIAFDPDHPRISESRFISHDWYDFYRDAEEPTLSDMPRPRGKGVSTHCFVDASHADNRSNRRSQTGILIFVNRAPIIWFSKRQNTVETSTFGSEIVAMKIAVELIQGIRFKLRSFGVPIEGPTNVYCDNEAVTKAARHPETTLAKKHNAVAYHKVREAVAMKMIRVAWEDTKTNLADLLTKTKSAPEREALIDRFMY